MSGGLDLVSPPLVFPPFCVIEEKKISPTDNTPTLPFITKQSMVSPQSPL